MSRKIKVMDELGCRNFLDAYFILLHLDIKGIGMKPSARKKIDKNMIIE